MPNWCSNYLSISGPYADVKRFTEEVKDKDSSGNDMVLSFNKHVPVWDGDNMIEGMDPCKDWGTKWNSDCSDMHNEGVFKLDSGDGEIQYSFQSAWGPPCEWLEAVVPMFPTLEFEMQYEEGGCDIYGISKGSEGVFTDNFMSLEEWLEETDEYYTSAKDTIKKMSQDDLIKYFSQVKNFTDWLQEDEEIPEGRNPGIDPEYNYWPLAGTIIEAIEVKNLPLFISVDWCDEELNNRIKDRLREGK